MNTLHTVTAPLATFEFDYTFVIFGLWAFIILFSALLHLIVSGGGDGYSTRKRTAVVTVVVSIVIFGIGSVSAFGVTNEVKRTAHHESVSSWLDSSYGISASGRGLNKLLGGDPIVTDYRGKTVVISLIENTDGKYSVVDEDRTVLTPTG